MTTVNRPRLLAIATAAAAPRREPGAGGAIAHGPDPALSGGAFGQNQDLRFRWRAGSEPAAVIKEAIKAAANDANATRASKAATFNYDTGGPSPIGYGAGATCGVNGLACFTRDVPDGFTMWFREQGHVFDWGTMKWCEAYASPPNGCYDAENVALDEFGHVEGLGHHVNFDSDSDYGDAVVQTYSRAKPNAGYNKHVFGRCDVARLQIMYDTLSTSAKYSTCLDMSTVLTITASPTQIVVGNSTTLTATLKVVDSDSYGRLGGNLVSGRTVTLQRRAVGTTAWTAVGTMPAGSVSGTYVLAQRPGGERTTARSSRRHRTRASTVTARPPSVSTSRLLPRSPAPSRRSRHHAPDQERSRCDVPLVRPSIRAGDPAGRAACECVRDRRAVRIGGAEPACDRLAGGRVAGGGIAGSRDRATGRDARGRRRRPGHRPARHVHLGRWRLGQPVAAGLADRRRDR